MRLVTALEQSLYQFCHRRVCLQNCVIWYGNNVFVGLVLLAERLLFDVVDVQSGLHLHRGVCDKATHCWKCDDI